MRPLSERAVIWLATQYRRFALKRVVFIGITGSCGKSTTKELISAVLSTELAVHRNLGNANQPFQIAKMILGVRPWSKCCVVELTPVGYGEILDFAIPLGIVRPQIGVLTNIGTDHISLFGTQDEIAEHKGKLVAALPASGVAVLNADDPRVFAMQARCRGRVISYGLAPQATLRAEDASSAWPQRLAFTVHHGGESLRVQTQLCGGHWLHVTLATIATGLAMGLPLQRLARSLQHVPPFEARFSPVRTTDDITFIRDDYKAPLWTVEPALQFMREAKAVRKIIVVGTISDYTANSKRSGSVQRQRVYTAVAQAALEIAEHVVFIGTQASKSLGAKHHADDNALAAFYSVAAARDYLLELLRPGDLVLLKGTHRQDRLVDIIDIFSARQAVYRQSSAVARENAQAPRHASALDNSRTHVIVGLGNPAAQFHGTRHNVGQQVLDRLSDMLGGQWREEESALVAQARWREASLLLVKPKVNINDTGPALKALSESLTFSPEQCVVVHDDIHLPPGTVRTRDGGGHGGHLGVRSVHSAFATDAMRRVKIGIGQPADRSRLAQYVVAPFSPEEVPVMERACATAAQRVLDAVARRPELAATAAYAEG